MIDYWKLVRDFKVGDVVQKLIPGNDGGGLSPFPGRVTAVLKGLGFVDVQWPFGNERVSPEELVRMNPEFLAYLPPTLDFSWYPGLDTQVDQLRLAAGIPADLWGTGLPIGFHRNLALLWNNKVGEVRAYDELWQRYASQADDVALLDETAKFYRFATTSAEKYFRYVVTKMATYWVAQNRQHRVTKEELASKRPCCPRCKGPLRKTTYKMREGQRMHLFVCPSDLFVIRRDDIYGPDGKPVEW